MSESGSSSVATTFASWSSTARPSLPDNSSSALCGRTGVPPTPNMARRAAWQTASSSICSTATAPTSAKSPSRRQTSWKPQCHELARGESGFVSISTGSIAVVR